MKKEIDPKEIEKETNHNNYIKNKVKRDTKAFMKSVRDFLVEKGGGDSIPPEWLLSVQMLETYYAEFIELTLRIEELPSLTIEGRYGTVANPILGVRDKAAARLESLMAKMGLTLKSARDLGARKITKEKNALETFMAKKMKAEEKKKEGVEFS